MTSVVLTTLFLPPKQKDVVRRLGYTETSFESFSGKCVNGSTTNVVVNGSDRIWLEDCDQVAESWAVTSDGYIMNKFYSRACIAANGVNEPIQYTTCTTDSQMKWTLESSGLIRSQWNSNYCFRADDPMEDGSTISLAACDADDSLQIFASTTYPDVLSSILTMESSMIEVYYCPSEKSIFHPHDGSPVKIAGVTTIDDCTEECGARSAANGDDEICEFAYFSNSNECYLYQRTLDADGQYDPPDYQVVSCSADHTTTNGKFLVEEYELFVYFSEDRVLAGDLPLKMVSALDTADFSSQYAFLGEDLLSDADTSTNHCSGSYFQREGYSDAAGQQYCYRVEYWFQDDDECDNQVNNCYAAAECGYFDQQINYNWQTDLSEETTTDAGTLWDESFKYVVKTALNGAMGYLNDAVEYNCDNQGDCDRNYREITTVFLNDSFTMPEEGGVVLVRHEQEYTAGTTPVKEVAHFSYDFGEKSNEYWYTTVANPDSICSAEAAVAIGIAGFLPIVGTAIGAVGVGVTIGCAAGVF